MTTDDQTAYDTASVAARAELAVMKRCDQCGRRGTRGFVTIPKDHQGRADGVVSFTVCAAGPACRKRRGERGYPDD